MPISADTEAMVAAQLTQAWAVRKGIRNPGNMPARYTLEQELLAKYRSFREAVRQVDSTVASEQSAES